MTRKARLLDLFCGAGGAGVGYSRAGFEVVGVDIDPQPHYPFEFWQMDAFDAIPQAIDFDAVHASPPCQGYSAMNRISNRPHPLLIERVRTELLAIGRPFAIENVEGAPLRNAFTLCGTAFGLGVRRHRLFELHPLPFALLPPCTCGGAVARGELVGHREGGKVAPGRFRPPTFGKADRQKAMGIDWMTNAELRQAIPPAYTEWVGQLLMEQVQGRRHEDADPDRRLASPTDYGGSQPRALCQRVSFRRDPLFTAPLGPENRG